MLTYTASQAKQNLGALLAQLALGPVAIERHRKTVAVVMSPGSVPSQPDPRHAARLMQQQREMQRLMHHQAVAIELLCAPDARRQTLIQEANATVQRWENEHLCSPDYINRWQQWLTLPTTELATLMCSAADGWGPAMRQNSPFTPKAPAVSAAHATCAP